jgi:O-antigen/teichoic acid export membrane protein
VGVLIAVALVLSLVLPAGINSAIARYVPYSMGQGDLASARGTYAWLWRVGIGSSAALGLIAAAGAAYVGARPDDVVQVGLLTAAYSVYVIYKAGLYAFDRVGRYLRLEILCSVIIVVTTVVVLLARERWFLVPQVAGYAAFGFTAHLALSRHAAGARAVRRSERFGIAMYVVVACVGTVASAGFLQLTQILAAVNATLGDAAYFTATITLVSALYFLPRALSLALFPFLAEAHGAGDLDAVRTHADRTTRALLCLLAPLFAIAITLAGEALAVYGGSRFYAGALIMQLVLVASYLSVIQVPSVNALSSASGHGLRRTAGWAVTGACAGLLSMTILGPAMGGPGIALAYLFGTGVTACGPVIAVWRQYRMSWAGPLLRAVGVVAIAFLGARLLVSVVPANGIPWIRDGAAALLATVVSAAVLHRDLLWAWHVARQARLAELAGARSQAQSPVTGVGP